MKIKGVDTAKCTLCGECILECPPELFSFKEESGGGKTVAYDDRTGRCIYCGHCVAVCAYDAIDYESEEPVKTFEGIGKPESLVDYETFSKFIFARRSIRRFTNQSVPEEAIKKILEAMRYAPSASNKQLWQYIVVTDSETRDSIARYVLALFAMIKRLLKFKWLIIPFLGRENRKLIASGWLGKVIERTIADFEKGRDRILFKAPCVIILYSPSYGNTAGNDAGIALTIGMFAAQALGLGTCWLGFAEEAFMRSRRMRMRFGIPKGHAVRGVLALGYPNVRFSRVPVRKPLNVRWM